jgi:hypothetical protein
MFKFLVTIALIIGILEVRGQTCVVKSFRWEDPRDVKDMPNWIPATNNKIPFTDIFQIPVRFQLPKKK